jgi:hypothetical protein
MGSSSRALLQGRGLRRDHRSNANIQQQPIRPLCDARSRYAAIESKIAGYRAALADVQPLTNRRTKFVVLAFESSGWTNPTVQKLVNVWEQRALRRLGPDRR